MCHAAGKPDTQYLVLIVNCHNGDRHCSGTEYDHMARRGQGDAHRTQVPAWHSSSPESVLVVDGGLQAQVPSAAHKAPPKRGPWFSIPARRPTRLNDSSGQCGQDPGFWSPLGPTHHQHWAEPRHVIEPWPGVCLGTAARDHSLPGPSGVSAATGFVALESKPERDFR